MDLNGKNILITGASRGIGFAVLNELLKYNCNIAAVARKTESIEKLFESYNTTDRILKAYSCDVSDAGQVNECWGNISADFDIIDLAILNAGVGYHVSPENYNSDAAEKTFGVNVMGMVRFIEKLLPGMLERKSGVIAGVSSLADSRGFSGSGFYCASKAAVTTHLEGLRIELRGSGVKIITVKPGFVKTDMTDQNNFSMPFLMMPDKAADIIIKGIIKEKREISFPFITMLGSKLVGRIPDSLYEFFARFANID